MYPAGLILLWIYLIIAIQSLQVTELLLAGFLLLAMAYALSASRLITLMACYSL
jgi:hypothetical protein